MDSIDHREGGQLASAGQFRSEFRLMLRLHLLDDVLRVITAQVNSACVAATNRLPQVALKWETQAAEVGPSKV